MWLLKKTNIITSVFDQGIVGSNKNPLFKEKIISGFYPFWFNIVQFHKPSSSRHLKYALRVVFEIVRNITMYTVSYIIYYPGHYLSKISVKCHRHSKSMLSQFFFFFYYIFSVFDKSCIKIIYFYYATGRSLLFELVYIIYLVILLTRQLRKIEFRQNPREGSKCERYTS